MADILRPEIGELRVREAVERAKENALMMARAVIELLSSMGKPNIPTSYKPPDVWVPLVFECEEKPTEPTP